MNSHNPEIIAPGLPRRFAAIFYDLLLVTALLVCGSAIVTLPIGLTLGAEVAASVSQTWPFRLWLLAIPCLFYCLYWMKSGQTLGMRVWRLWLISDTGGRVTLKQALIRLFGALISWAALGLGFFWALQDPEKLTWYDRLSKTRLILR